MKFKYFSIILILISLIGLGGCSSDSTVLLPNVNGKAFEVVVVINDAEWNSDLGGKLRDILQSPQPALPQEEPMFDLINIPTRSFTNLFKRFRNLIVVDLSSKYKEANILVDEDVNASPQTIVTLVGPNESSVTELLEKKRVVFLDILIDAERQRTINNYKRYEERSIRESLERHHKLALTLPKGYTLDLDTNNFVWISHEEPNTSQGIFVYYYPYTDTAAFTSASLIAMRDTMLKKYVAGPTDGSYMTTERDYFQPILDEYSIDGRYIAELKGLWKVEGDFMGGPFVSLSTVDEKKNRVVTVEGYVYSPRYDKRNYLRQVEAILHTLGFPGKD